MTQDSGLGTRDSGLRAQGSGLRTQDSGLRTQDSGLRTQDSGLKVPGPRPNTPILHSRSNTRQLRIAPASASMLALP
ncbi:hypothetical protein DIJ61_22045 [Burkholderia pseudomallei]|nr:hypothetical protein CF649_24005 [Burkholderia sp. 136(2017)]PNX35713.1 hypothetical protein CF648_24010 [Burkholderia sp. 137]TOZ57238.1 hypothetical protein DIJ60_14525 [Burkholderia pseudomallei]TPA13514.1 hypothetical protein DIJ61_22045 [Burkholderia pseudomallei]